LVISTNNSPSQAINRKETLQPERASTIGVLTLFLVMQSNVEPRHHWTTCHMHSNDALLQTIIRYFPAGMILLDTDLRLTYANQQFLDLLDLPERLGGNGSTTVNDIVRYCAERGDYGPGDIEKLIAKRMLTVGSGQFKAFDFAMRSGRILEVQNVPLDDGRILRTYVDVTARRQEEVRMMKLARYDSLTDLPNRTTFRECLDKAVEESGNDRRVAVLYLDLDRFKAVNDTLGHPVGDALLQTVAKRLRGCTRPSDTVCRLGGDEFAVVMRTPNPARDAAALARRIIRSVSAPYVVDGHHIEIGTSVGIALGNQKTSSELIKNADAALYRSKNSGRGRYSVFSEAMVCPEKIHTLAS
jgi:diguanylate cyclase (GGDEF)-like protein